MNTKRTFDLDEDDERDVNAAIAEFQRRGARFDDGELILGEGESCFPGAILGEICRSWLESLDRLYQEGRKE